MSVKLRKKINTVKDATGKTIQSGTTSLYLDIYHNGKRSYEFLKDLKLVTKPQTPQDRESNRENVSLAERIATKRNTELTATDYDIPTDNGKKTLVVSWMQSYVDKYKKKDVRNMQGALNRFINFLADENITGLTFGRLSEVIIADFQAYLRERSTGEGSSSYFNRFKKMVKHAYRQNLIIKNIAADVPTIQGKAKKKDVLTLEEIQIIAKTQTESPEVKRAALFSLVTGLRWIDIKALRWEDINLNEGFLKVTQSKTENSVQVNLNATAIGLLGNEGTGLVFKLPSANGANKTLNAIVKRAKIKKNITWHCLRHSYGTNLSFTGADIVTVSSLLGHTSLKHTQRYVRAAKELKERAVDKLNFNL